MCETKLKLVSQIELEVFMLMNYQTKKLQNIFCCYQRQKFLSTFSDSASATSTAMKFYAFLLVLVFVTLSSSFLTYPLNGESFMSKKKIGSDKSKSAEGIFF